jgi:hypothetical protein
VTTELQQVYIVDGVRYDTQLDAMTALERKYGYAHLFPEWLDVTTHQDAAEGRQLWLCGNVMARNEMYGKWHLLTPDDTQDAAAVRKPPC